MEVANTILQQLGGNRFKAMTGAKSFIGSPSALRFNLPTGSTKNKANAVRIELTADDDYRVRFYAVRGANIKTVSIHEGIYADDLQSLIEEQTGLATHF